MKKLRHLLSLFLVVSFCTPALADRSIAPRKGACGDMEEQVSVNVSFNAQLPSPLEAKERFEARLKEIEGLARDSQIKKWSLQSLNYSVSTYNSGYGMDATFQLSGSASYQTDNADQAFALMDKFSKRGMQLNVSVNKYRSGTCEGDQ